MFNKNLVSYFPALEYNGIDVYTKKFRTLLIAVLPDSTYPQKTILNLLRLK
jgi:hypothetical protein